MQHSRYEPLGIEVHLTEVDVGCATGKRQYEKGFVVEAGKQCEAWGEVEEQKQAEVYSALLQACLDSPACKNFETWGFTDEHTWRQGKW